MTRWSSLIAVISMHSSWVETEFIILLCFDILIPELIILSFSYGRLESTIYRFYLIVRHLANPVQIAWDSDSVSITSCAHF